MILIHLSLTLIIIVLHFNLFIMRYILIFKFFWFRYILRITLAVEIIIVIFISFLLVMGAFIILFLFNELMTIILLLILLIVLIVRIIKVISFIYLIISISIPENLLSFSILVWRKTLLTLHKLLIFRLIREITLRWIYI